MARLIDALEGIGRLLSWIAIGIISLLSFPMVYDVVLREAGHPTIWAFELTTYALIAGTFLANAHALASGRHFRVTVLLHAAPRLKTALNWFAFSATLVFGLLIMISGAMYVHQSFVDHLRSPTLLSIPLYLPQLALPLGGLSLVVQTLAIMLAGRFPELPENRPRG